MAVQRVSQQSLFSNFTTNLNASMTKLMELNIQNSSQKRINRPSDDGAGTARGIARRAIARMHVVHPGRVAK